MLIMLFHYDRSLILNIDIQTFHSRSIAIVADANLEYAKSFVLIYYFDLIRVEIENVLQVITI